VFNQIGVSSAHYRFNHGFENAQCNELRLG